MSDPVSVSAPKSLKQRFGAQVGRFNNHFGELAEGRYTLTFDRTVDNRVNLHAGSPDEPAVASALFTNDAWTTNDGQAHRTLADAAEHMISIRAEPRGEIEGDDATEVQGHPKATVTGRLSVGQPEMQTLGPIVQVDPQIDTETLRGADFSDFEQRILARMTPEQIAAFKAGEGVAVDLDGLTPGAMPCKEVIVIGGGRGDDLFQGGDRRSSSFGRSGRVGMLGAGVALAAAAAATINVGPSERTYGYGHTALRDVTPRPTRGPKPKKPKMRSSYSPCKGSVTDQHKGSGDAKKAAHSVHKAAKASKRAARAKKLAKIAARAAE